jgi:hypothetical protein
VAPRERRSAAIATGCLAFTLFTAVEWGLFAALVVAAMLAFSAWSIRAAYDPAPEPAPVLTTDRSRPAAPRRRVAQPQNSLGRLFAERPAWSGPPITPFRPPRGGEQLTIPLDE